MKIESVSDSSLVQIYFEALSNNKWRNIKEVPDELWENYKRARLELSRIEMSLEKIFREEER